MANSVAFLPLDMASVVVPVPDTPDLILKHVDGELVRIQRTDTGDYQLATRHEHDVTWSDEGSYESLEGAVLAATDMQAFGIRRAGVPSNIIEAVSTDEPPASLLEIEPLERGGIVVDSRAHLPVMFHMTSGAFWRLRVGIEVAASESRKSERVYRLEYRDDVADNWETVETIKDMVAPVDAVRGVMDTLPIQSLQPPSASAMKRAIEEASLAFVVAEFDESALASRAGTQQRTLDFEDRE